MKQSRSVFMVFCLGLVLSFGLISILGSGGGGGGSSSAPAPAPTPEPRATLSGTFIINDNPDIVNGDPSTDTFDAIQGLVMNYLLSFIVSNEQTRDEIGMLGTIRKTCFATDDLTVAFTGDASGTLNVMATNLNAADHEICYDNDSGTVSLNFGNLVGDDSGSIYFGFEMTDPNITISLDASDYPVLESFGDTPTTIMLRRYTSTPFDMTDFASGPGTVSANIP